MSQLNHDTLYLILEFINHDRDGGDHVISFFSVCKYWNEMEQHEITWKILLSNWLKVNTLKYSEMKKKLLGKQIDKKCDGALSCLRGIVSKVKKMDSNNENSMKFGQRFKDLFRTALYNLYRINMTNGLDVIINNFEVESILQFKHSNFFGQFYLDHAKKFIENKLINQEQQSKEELEYWKKFSTPLFEYLIQKRKFDNCEILKKFKPMLNDSILMEMLFQDNGKESLEMIKNYIVENKENGGYKLCESDSNILFSDLQVTNMEGFKYLKECMKILYPQRKWSKILDDSVKNHRLELISGNFDDFPTFFEFCKIAELEKIELHIACRYCKIFSLGFNFLHEMFKSGLIDLKDMKLLLHKYHFRDKEVMKIIEIMPQDIFDPYECVLDHRGKAHNFVHAFLTKPNCAMSLYFNNYFTKYPKFDLFKLIHRMNETDGGNRPERYMDKFVIDLIEVLFAYYQFNWFEAIDSITILGKFILHSLNIECLVVICRKYHKWHSEDTIWEAGCANSFKTLLEQVHCIDGNGDYVPFVEYCETFYQNYDHSQLEYDIYSEDVNWKIENREYLAKLYHIAKKLIENLNPDDLDMNYYNKIRYKARFVNWKTYEKLYEHEDF